MNIDYTFMKSEDTSYLLDVLTSMAITRYNLGVMGIDADLSIQFSEIIKELKNRGVTLEQIDVNIMQKDFTKMLVNYGSGNRERGFLMEVIEEYYYE